jgi:hypothetical protein
MHCHTTFIRTTTMPLSSTDLSTRISSLWKGYKTRKIFTDHYAVSNWDDYDELNYSYNKKVAEKAPDYILLAWDAALDKTFHRLSRLYPHPCSCCQDDHDNYDDYGDTGLDWNESGYFD